MPRSPRVDRRAFLKHSSALAGAAALTGGVFGQTAAKAVDSPNERIRLAFVGSANQARFSIGEIDNLGQEFMAFCDIDDNYLDRAKADYPDARLFYDYREMIPVLSDDIDAVVVACADHSHALASLTAIKAGKHVYCEKPLTHTVEESRILAEAAAKMGVATQMGTQIHAGDNYRRVVEIIQSGAIGDVTEVHVWVGKAWGGGELPENTQEPPLVLHWDLWLGGAPERAFAPGRYHPGQWRRWWDFGGGTLGDMGCHYIDLPFWALKLRHPTKCWAEGPEVHPETCPLGMKAHYEYPERDGLAACTMTWYDGNMIPSELGGQRVPGAGVMFIGDGGMMFADYNNWRLFPAADFSGYEPPEPTIPSSIGHHAEWLQACRDGSPTTCNFDYSGALSESVLLGNVAYRTGETLEWDAETLTATNCPAADQYIRKEYREGWEVTPLEG